jgi:hypothetical protein
VAVQRRLLHALDISSSLRVRPGRDYLLVMLFAGVDERLQLLLHAIDRVKSTLQDVDAQCPAARAIEKQELAHARVERTRSVVCCSQDRTRGKIK